MKRDIELLKHISTDINDILLYTTDLNFDDFISNSMVRKAVCMSLINIGELTKNLSPAFKAKHKQIPWKSISGLRDITAHKYHTLNLDIVWSVVINDIPKLNEFISNL
jgi:uncharacterized protein with HEPN domain